MTRGTLFMETTDISVQRTVNEIQTILGQYGVTGVMTLFEKGEISAVCFQVMYLDRTIPFRLPCRWEQVYQYLLKRRKNMLHDSQRIEALKQQAKKVAWRQILRWIEAQMALVETNMVKVHEVFLPYIQTSMDGETLFDRLENTKYKMLENKSVT